MVSHTSYRTPDVDELWYNSSSGKYYVSRKAGELIFLRFNLPISQSPGTLLQAIKDIQGGGGQYITHNSACEGQHGWVLVSENWVKYVQDAALRTIEGIIDTLRECMNAVGDIE